MAYIDFRHTFTFHSDRHSSLSAQLEQIVKTLLRVLLDQVDHALLVVSFVISSFAAFLRCLNAYRWHDGLSVLADNVTERHLGALIRICSDLWVIDIWDLVDGDCTTLVAASMKLHGTYFGLERRSS